MTFNIINPVLKNKLIWACFKDNIGISGSSLSVFPILWSTVRHQISHNCLNICTYAYRSFVFRHIFNALSMSPCIIPTNLLKDSQSGLGSSKDFHLTNNSSLVILTIYM